MAAINAGNAAILDDRTQTVAIENTKRIEYRNKSGYKLGLREHLSAYVVEWAWL